MKLNRFGLVLFISGLSPFLFSGAAHADFVYLRPDSVDIGRFPAPPTLGSSEDEADLEGVHKAQDERSRADCARAGDEAGATLVSFYGMSHAVLSAPELALVDGLFNDIENDAEEFNGPLKEMWARLRPFVRDPTIHPCIPSPKGYSYPSGHAALARVTALAFGLVFPERALPLLARGDEVGFDRIIAGVHHPRDVEAGRLLGDELFTAFEQSPEFMRRIDEIRHRLPHTFLTIQGL